MILQTIQSQAQNTNETISVSYTLNTGQVETQHTYTHNQTNERTKDTHILCVSLFEDIDTHTHNTTDNYQLAHVIVHYSHHTHTHEQRIIVYTGNYNNIISRSHIINAG